MWGKWFTVNRQIFSQNSCQTSNRISSQISLQFSGEFSSQLSSQVKFLELIGPYER